MRIFGIFVTSVLFGAMVIAENAPAVKERTSENTPALKKALEQYPDADSDGDGILTMKEADAYRAKLRSKAGKKGGEASGGIAPTMTDIQYGRHERNVFDLWKITNAGAERSPLLICFHGGGFVGGDKSKYRTDPIIATCLKAGIAVASGNYRFVTTDPFPAPQMDGARMIQYIRLHAKEFGIDPKRIGLTGGSAGANMSLWIALHNDLADPKSSDPAARESTRVSFVIANAAQTSNDPEFIREHIYSGSSLHSSLMSAFGITNTTDITNERVRKLAYDVSAINFATKDDPPLLLIYRSPLSPTPLPEGTPQGEYIHHPKFGVLLKEKYDKLGADCRLYHAEKPIPADEEIRFMQMFFGKIGMK